MRDTTKITKRFVWAEINLKNLGHNLSIIKSYVNSSQTKIMAIVKADAYGHGAVEVSRQAVKSGVYGLGVSLVEEGIKLRKAGINVPIYILGEPSLSVLEDAVKYNLILSVNSYKTADIISKKCSYLGKKAVVHINVDTGMNRIGISFKNAISEIIKISSLPGLKIEGVFTHFSCAYRKDDSYTKLQWNKFRETIQELKNNKVRIGLFHCANSAAFLRYKKMHMDMVRIGILMYGLNPFDGNSSKWLSKETADVLSNFKSVLSLKAKISFIKRIPAGQYISYGCTFRTKRESVIATIPVGYADGYSRLLSNKSKVLINGKFAPVVGNVTMDQIMIDATDVTNGSSISTGDEIVLIGDSEGKRISAEDLADLAGTINYEIVCMLKSRIPRIYGY